MNPFGFQILTILTVVNGDTAFLTICLAKRVLDNLKELLKMELADNVADGCEHFDLGRHVECSSRLIKNDQINL